MIFKNNFLIALVLLCSCGGKLSDEQRKAIRESMEEGQIKRITDAELTEAAYAFGRSIIQDMAKDELTTTSVAAFEEKYKVKISTLQSGDSALMEIEKMIIDAYTSGATPELSDNIQKLGQDSLLYTKPIMKTLPDGSVEFEKAIGIHMPTKQVVLSIKD
jgi:hypothetical protein